MSKLVFITGGARGIGAAIRSELVHRGYTVVAPTRAELDLEQAESIESYVESHRHLPVDILINNAGINTLNEVSAIRMNDFESMLKINLTASLRLLQTFAPGMADRGWGRILSISSIFSVVARERRGAYSITKAAINALTRTAAIEFGPHGVLVNALAPGYVDTDLTRQNNTAQTIAELQKSIPLRRLASTAEIAKTAAFLVSEENTYLTGQTILVDGGFTCQ